MKRILPLVWFITAGTAMLHAENNSKMFFTPSHETKSKAQVHRQGLKTRNSLPAVSHDRVNYFINLYSQRATMGSLERTMKRAEPYLGYIAERIEYYNLPFELVYLPVIESNYDNNAVSHVGAVGIWQFMKGSAAPYGLAMDEWRDDRKDIYLATDAALRKIKAEYEELDDILLTIAAYNCGIGRVKRAKKISESRGVKPTFWNIYQQNLLPRETLNYVPKLLAVSQIYNNKLDYGLKIQEQRSKSEAEGLNPVRIKSPQRLDLRKLAAQAGLDYHVLADNNKGLKSALTPPSYAKNYFLNVPATYQHQVRVAMVELLDNKDKAFVYTSSEGEDLGALSKKFGLSKKTLTKLNAGLDMKKLAAGSNVIVLGAENSLSENPKTGSYTVKNGDSLWSISLRFGMHTNELAAFNNIDVKKVLKPGLKLEVPL